MSRPSLTEQDLLQEALARRAAPLDGLERRAELITGGGFLIAVALLWTLGGMESADWNLGLAAACLIALTLSMRVRFDIAGVYTVPAQLAFVPMFFAAPPAALPLLVVASLVMSRLPEVLKGEVSASRLTLSLANGWFAVGPAAMLLLLGGSDALTEHPVLIASVFAAQVTADFVASSLRERLVRGATLREQIADAGWIYGVDAALTPVAFVAVAPVGAVWGSLALAPLLLLLRSFARERSSGLEAAFELTRAYRGMALVLGDVVEADDQYTGEHCRDVVELALMVGDALGVAGDSRRNLEFGALLHDVGKVAMPKELINKPGRLTPEEYEIIKTHTTIGQAMLDRVGGFMREVGRIVRHHHERWDGAGYPDGIAGRAIPIEARIVACCDTFNAITTTRSYRAAQPATVALDELRRCAGTQFDPDVVDALVRAVRERAFGAVMRSAVPVSAVVHAPDTTPAVTPAVG